MGIGRGLRVLALALAFIADDWTAACPLTAAATHLVTTDADSGPGSLREAILQAQAGDVIAFAPSLAHHTVTLKSPLPTILASLTITAADVPGITIDGSNAFRVFDARGRLTIDGLTIAHGRSYLGGGIFAFGNALTVMRSKVIYNVSTNNWGAGILALDAPLTLIDSVVSDNSGPGAGGGVAIITTSYPELSTITNSAIIRNTSAGRGAGILVRGAKATVLVENSTIAENHTIPGEAVGGGGGIGIDDSATAAFIQSTIADNSDGGLEAGGGGLFVAPGSTVTLHSTIVARNTTEGDGPDIFGRIAGAAYVLLGIEAGQTGVFNRIYGTVTGTIDQPLDPRLGPLADNGGPTPTMELLPGSPAIDAVLGGWGCTDVDQRGTSKPSDGNGDGIPLCDLGAYEVNDSCPMDPLKIESGLCGCGVQDTDADENGIPDCELNAELKARIALARSFLSAWVKPRATDSGSHERFSALVTDVVEYVQANRSGLVITDSRMRTDRLMRRLKVATNRLAHTSRHRAVRIVRAAVKTLDAFDTVVAPQG